MTPFFLSQSMKLVTVASNSLVNKIEGNLILKHAMVKNYKSKKYGLKIRLLKESDFGHFSLFILHNLFYQHIGLKTKTVVSIYLSIIVKYLK